MTFLRHSPTSCTDLEENYNKLNTSRQIIKPVKIFKTLATVHQNAERTSIYKHNQSLYLVPRSKFIHFSFL